MQPTDRLSSVQEAGTSQEQSQGAPTMKRLITDATNDDNALHSQQTVDNRGKSEEASKSQSQVRKTDQKAQHKQKEKLHAVRGRRGLRRLL